MNTLCEMVFILDRSGSMHGLESDTIGGFNSMIEAQRKEDIRSLITVALFDDRLEIPFDREDLKDIPEMTERIYFTRGCTALYDAVGTMILRVKKHRRGLTSDEIPGKTVFVITTDGYENASREFSGAEVRRMIEAQTEAGWEFLYLGANIDAAAEAEKIGIRAQRAARYHADPIGVRKNFETVGRALADFATTVESEAMCDSWADDIRADYKSRSASR